MWYVVDKAGTGFRDLSPSWSHYTWNDQRCARPVILPSTIAFFPFMAVCTTANRRRISSSSPQIDSLQLACSLIESWIDLKMNLAILFTPQFDTTDFVRVSRLVRVSRQATKRHPGETLGTHYARIGKRLFRNFWRYQALVVLSGQV